MRIKSAINLGITFTLMLSLGMLLANPVWAAPNNKISKIQCTDGEIPKFNGNLNQWECAADENTDNTQAICDLYRLTGNTPPSDCPICASGDRYEDQFDGTVVDCSTNLVWLKDASCGDLAGTNAAGKANWDNANAAAAALSDGTCDLTDGSAAGEWRLPTIEEFCSQGASVGICPAANASDSLVNSNFNSPTVSNTAGDGQWSEGDPFVGVQSGRFWSATEHDAGGAWVVGLLNGSVFVGDVNEDNSDFVWPVRGGQ